MNHTEYQRKLKTKTVPELLYIIEDAREARRVNPTNPKDGYYAEILKLRAAIRQIVSSTGRDLDSAINVARDLTSG